MESATGSGKSTWPTAIGHDYKTIVLTETKALQSQYSDIYDFSKVTGRNNHPCVHPDRLFSDATAEDCLFGTSMHKCPVATDCNYLIQKEIAKESMRAVLNYHYFQLVGNRRYGTSEFIWPKEFLFLDEAHSLAKSTVDFYSVEIKDRHKGWYGLPGFPEITPGMPERLRHDRALGWIRDSDAIVAKRVTTLKDDIRCAHGAREKQGLIKELRRAERIRMRFRLVLRAIENIPDDWFVKSDRGGFLAKPLTARHIFPAMYLSDVQANVVLMSATIGDFGAFTEELGIVDYEAKVVPSRFPPETRPILVPKCPRMSSKATMDDFELQADIIARLIGEAPEEWGGIILVTRKVEAALLRDRLARRGLGSRVWAAPGHDGTYTPTDEQIAEWEQRKRRVPNSLMITWSHWTGFDGTDERICIAAKAPYLPWGSPGSYDEAWRAYSMDRYRYAAAVTLTQGLGRTRRGRETDYDVDGRNGLVAVVDGSFDGRVKSMMGSDIAESLVEL